MESTFNENLTLQVLPSEVIINCLTYLNCEELKACRLVSHQFNDLILETSELARKLKFNIQFSLKSYDMDETLDLDQSVDLNSSIESNDEINLFVLKDSKIISQKKDEVEIESDEDLADLWNFVLSTGYSIRRLNINLNKFDNFSWKILDYMPNLEELTMNEQLLNVQATSTEENKIFNMTKLKILRINSNLLTTFITSTKNVTKLEKLKVFVSTEQDHEMLTNLIAQQKNLKELELEFDDELTSIDFPTSDITSKVKFQLRKFKFFKKDARNKSEYFNKFIESQAGYLEKFKFDFKPDVELSEIIIKKCKNLKKFELTCDSNDELFTNLNENWKLPSVTTFKSDVLENPSFNTIMSRIPKVNKLKTARLGLFDGKYESVTEIDAKLMMSNHYDCQFPNLKILNVQNILGLKIEDWMEFTLKHKNLEHLAIKGTFFCDDTEFGLEHLRHFEKLKTLKFRGKNIDCEMLREVASMN